MPPGWDNLFHVLNPSAARRAAVSAFMDKQTWHRVWIDRGSHPTHLETVMAWAVSEGHRDVAIWGGDGTLSRAVNALLELGALDKVRLILVPAGTCNDFSRKMTIPLWEDAVCSPFDWPEHRFDVGVVEHSEGHRAFVNNAGFGRTPDARREKRPSPVMDIFRLMPHAVKIDWTGNEASGQFEMSALMGIVFNAPYFGGGLHFSTDISPDDGRLEGYFLGNQPRWRVLWSFFRGRSGQPFFNRKTVSIKGSSIRVRSAGALFPQADGERASAGGLGDITFKVRPRALTMLVPK